MNTSMSLSLFTASIICEMQKKMGEKYRVLSSIVKKNNGVELTGIIIKEEGCNTSPTIYINDFHEEYKRGLPLETIVERLCEIFYKNRYNGSINLSDFAVYEKARKQLAFKVINYEKNWELLKEVPHKVFCNLAIVFYYVVSQSPFDGKASILIHLSHLKNWGISEEELYRDAMKNAPLILPPQIENIEDVMIGLLEKGISEEENRKEENNERESINIFLGRLHAEKQKERIPLYVLSNNKKILGAACMLYPGVLQKFAEIVNCNLYVLPSSVHEVILLPEDENVSGASLLAMVTEINRTQVEESEVLADSVYYYNKNTDKLERFA